MQWAPFSETQRRAMRESTARINAFDGPVRSGKTTAQRFAWVRHLKETPHPNLLITGQTKDTIRRNVLFDLFDLLDVCRVNYSYNQSEGTVRCLGATMHIVGANDEKAESRLRGLTVGGWLGDEVNLAPESFVKMALTRMSMAGAKAFWTFNPDSPYHYLYTDYLTNEALIEAGILKRITFRLDDNLSLSEEYKAALKALYAPGSLFYRRFILGEWVMAEGAIYQQWDERVHVVDEMPAKPERVVIGIDKGTQNATVFLAAGKVGKTWYIFDEYYHSGRDTGRQKTDGEYADDFIAWVGRLGYVPQSIEIDPSAANFKVELRERGVRRVRDADNSVLQGIEVVSTALTGGTLKVLRRCENLRAEFPNYVWDPKKQEKGEDAPLKGQGSRDHALDACRYLCMRVLSRPALKVLPKPIGL